MTKLNDAQAHPSLVQVRAATMIIVGETWQMVLRAGLVNHNGVIEVLTARFEVIHTLAMNRDSGKEMPADAIAFTRKNPNESGPFFIQEARP